MRVGLRAAREALQAGTPVAFPTETVYGLGVPVADEAAVARVFALKARPSFDPLIVHVAGPRDLEAVARPSPRIAALARRFWPGPLTVVAPREAQVPDLVTAGGNTVGVRAPDHPLARALIDACGPLAAPSANPFGGVSPTTAQHVEDGLGPDVAVLDGGPCDVGVESTVVAEEDGALLVLRPGGVPNEALQRAWDGPVRGTSEGPIRSPGQLPSHYAPRTPLRLDPWEPRTGRWGWIGAGTPPPGPWAAAESLGDDEVTAARRLFAALRRLDAAGLDGIVARLPPDLGLFRAIADRLRRAAAAAP
jgi:L-threonylcarbamoyladenylate synthase